MTEKKQEQYRALAEFRYLIFRALKKNIGVAKAAGLEPRQYLLLLNLHGIPRGKQPTIKTLAERLQSNHNTVVELVNRAVREGLVKRFASNKDGREVIIYITPKGQRAFAKTMETGISRLKKNDLKLVQDLKKTIVKMD